MSNLRPAVRTAIRNFIESQNESHIPIDVLRIIEHEANLMKETQLIFDSLDEDPFEELSEVQKQILSKLKSQLRVIECSRVRTGFDYCSIDAIVSIKPSLQLTFKYERQIEEQDCYDDDYYESNKCQKKKKKGRRNRGQKIWYSIDVSHNYGEKQKLLLIQVFAPNGIPSGEKAVCVTPSSVHSGDDGDEGGGWEDIDDDDDVDNNNNNLQSTEISETTATTPTTMIRFDSNAESSSTSEVSQSRKKQKLSNNTSSSTSSLQQKDHDGDETKEVFAKEEEVLHHSKQGKTNNTSTDSGSKEQEQDDNNEEGQEETNNNNSNNYAMIQHITNCDTFSTSIDPDVLHDFLESADLLPMGEATAFFLLMTFPFWEHEWDLVGFVLQEVFGASPHSDSDDEPSDYDDDDDGGNGNDAK